MKSFYVWLALALFLIGCSKDPTNKVVENPVTVVSQPTPEDIERTNARLKEIKKNSDRAFKIKQRDMISDKLDILFEKIKYKQQNASLKDLDNIQYVLRTVGEICTDTENIDDLSFEVLQDCENFIDRSNSTL